jgi:hypothetical protein
MLIFMNQQNSLDLMPMALGFGPASQCEEAHLLPDEWAQSSVIKEATLFLNETLNLPATGCEQDWDIELSDPNRITEFITFMETHDLDGERNLR